MEKKLHNLWELWKDWNERRISGDFAMHQISHIFWGDIKKENERQRLATKKELKAQPQKKSGKCEEVKK